MSGEYLPEPDLRLVVQPEPTDEEMAAIASAVMVLRRQVVASMGSGISETPTPVSSRWAIAGRREAMRGLDRDESR
ncbi:MAG: hypothetical protein QM589_08375 [Thermomicrobiales bacterium]